MVDRRARVRPDRLRVLGRSFDDSAGSDRDPGADRLVGDRATREARSVGDSFHCRTGSIRLMRKRVRCSDRETENHSFTR